MCVSFPLSVAKLAYRNLGGHHLTDLGEHGAPVIFQTGSGRETVSGLGKNGDSPQVLAISEVGNHRLQTFM